MKKNMVYVILIIFSGIMTNLIYGQEYGRELDSLALVALYDSADGANWSNNSNWLTDEPIDYWYGVTVEDDRVNQLLLSSNNLNGTIPDEICNLTELNYLNFYVNSLSGSIPDDIGNLSKLTHLSLNHNQLEGPIPESLWQLSSLTQLFLNSNNLTGSLSEDFC